MARTSSRFHRATPCFVPSMSFKQARKCQLLRVLQLETYRVVSPLDSRIRLKPFIRPLKSPRLCQFYETALMSKEVFRYKFEAVTPKQRQAILQPLLQVFEDTREREKMKVAVMSQALQCVGLPVETIEKTLNVLFTQGFVKKTKLKLAFSREPDCVIVTEHSECTPQKLEMLVQGLWNEINAESVVAVADKLVQLGITKEYHLAAMYVHRFASHPPKFTFSEFRTLLLPTLLKTCLLLMS